MKKLFAIFCLLPTAVFADIKQEFVTSAQISVDSCSSIGGSSAKITNLSFISFYQEITDALKNLPPDHPVHLRSAYKLNVVDLQ